MMMKQLEDEEIRLEGKKVLIRENKAREKLIDRYLIDDGDARKEDDE